MHFNQSFITLSSQRQLLSSLVFRCFFSFLMNLELPLPQPWLDDGTFILQRVKVDMIGLLRILGCETLIYSKEIYSLNLYTSISLFLTTMPSYLSDSSMFMPNLLTLTSFTTISRMFFTLIIYSSTSLVSNSLELSMICRMVWKDCQLRMVLCYEKWEESKSWSLLLAWIEETQDQLVLERMSPWENQCYSSSLRPSRIFQSSQLLLWLMDSFETSLKPSFRDLLEERYCFTSRLGGGGYSIFCWDFFGSIDFSSLLEDVTIHSSVSSFSSFSFYISYLISNDSLFLLLFV